MLVSPAIGALLLPSLGAVPLVLADAATFAVAAILFVSLPAMPAGRRAPSHPPRARARRLHRRPPPADAPRHRRGRLLIDGGDHRPPGGSSGTRLAEVWQLGGRRPPLRLGGAREHRRLAYRSLAAAPPSRGDPARHRRRDRWHRRLWRSPERRRRTSSSSSPARRRRAWPRSRAGWWSRAKPPDTVGRIQGAVSTSRYLGMSGGAALALVLAVTVQSNWQVLVLILAIGGLILLGASALGPRSAPRRRPPRLSPPRSGRSRTEGQ